MIFFSCKYTLLYFSIVVVPHFTDITLLISEEFQSNREKKRGMNKSRGVQKDFNEDGKPLIVKSS